MKHQTLGQFLKKVREDRGLTLREVEASTGVSNAYLSQIEGDKIKQPSPIWLHKLGNLYYVSYAMLLALAGYPVPGEERNAAIHSGLAARLGSVTAKEEDDLVEYLQFLRSRRAKKVVR